MLNDSMKTILWLVFKFAGVQVLFAVVVSFITTFDCTICYENVLKVMVHCGETPLMM